MVVLLALLGCGPELTEVDPQQVLTRASLDLRGVRPSVAEREALADDPAVLDDLLADYLQDPRLGERVRELWSEVYLTRAEFYAVNIASLGVETRDVLTSVGEEPLRLLEHITLNDLPYTDIVTADYTMANETLASIWPLDREAGEGWQVARYTDERPTAGALTMNGLWWRYLSTDSNANRSRAAAVSRIFVCHNYLERPISFDRNVNLLDQGAVNDALRTNPSCINCHASLDGIGSYFFGFWSYAPDSPFDAAIYHPERERRWVDYTGVAPAWHGEPGDDLSDLGHQIAADHRFPSCAAEQALRLLSRHEPTPDAIARVRDAFVTGDLTVRELLRSAMSEPLYRASETPRMVTPALMASQIEDLTGYRWTVGGVDVMQSDASGFRQLAGGADGVFVTQPARDPAPTIVLVQERLAQAAAEHVVLSQEHELFDIASPHTPDRFEKQVVAWHWLLYGTRVEEDGPELTAARELWDALYELHGDAPAAWSGLLSAYLRDPELLFY